METKKGEGKWRKREREIDKDRGRVTQKGRETKVKNKVLKS